MAGYIGNYPTAVPLTGADLTDGIITSAKIANGTIVGDDINSTFDLTGKTVTGAGGITMADMWRVTGGFNTSGGDITTNWERADAVQYGTIGTGLTESSGIFSFPQTGIYYIHFVTYFDGSTGNPNYAGVNLQLSYDNGSNWGTATQMYTSSLNSSAHGNISLNYIADITNTSNDKLKFGTDVESTYTVAFGGNTTQQRTGFVIFRLGDT